MKVGGAYTLSLSSDDGSKLYVDGGLIVHNDGIHAMRTKTGKHNLCVGPHRLWIEYFEKVGKSGVIFKYRGPDSSNSMVSAGGGSSSPFLF